MRPGAVLMEAYGQTETLGPVLRPNPMGPVGTCGVEASVYTVKVRSCYVHVKCMITIMNV